MKILALENELPGLTTADFVPHLKDEARRIWELQQSGDLREVYFNANRHTAVLVLEFRDTEAARQLLDRTSLRWPDTLQLAAAIVARDMFQATEIIFVSASPLLLEAAKNEGFHTIDPAKEAAAKEAE